MAAQAHRFLVSPKNIRGSAILIVDPHEVHHLRDVLRLGVGDELTAFDGEGHEYLGRVAKSARGAVELRIERALPARDERLLTWLLPALPKGGRFEWLVQKATELGVARITPLVTRHGVVRLTAEQGRAKCARWRRLGQEAAKQCGRSQLPRIDEPLAFDQAIASLSGAGLVVIPTLAVSAVALSDVLRMQRPEGAVAALIGPEGDFTPEEVALAQAHGARPVSLGPLTLRCETAALAVLTLLRAAQGGFE